MEGLPKTTEIKEENQPGAKTLEEIQNIQKGRSLETLSVQELKDIKAKYINLKQELGIGVTERDEAMETSYEQAQEIMGESFYGNEEIKNTFGFELVAEKIPAIPYSPETLEKARENGEMLMLRVESDDKGSPMTMEKMNEMIQAFLEEDSEEKQERLLYDTDWYENEDFFKNAPLRTEWRLVGKEFIPDSTSKNYVEQTKILRDHMLGLGSLSKGEQEECTDELLEGLQKMLDEDYDKNWKEVAEKLSELLVNKNHRRIPAEILYDWVIRFRNRKERGVLKNNYDWSNTLSSHGYLVFVGDADRNGVSVNYDDPGLRSVYLGVVSLR